MPLSDSLERFLSATAPSHDDTQIDMARHAAEHDFPIIGRAAGGVLATLARARGAERVFEFGSGFGYSASWFLKGMEPGGSIVLTEIDRDELDHAERFLAERTDTYRIHFEHGDAAEIFDRYEGAFDMVLIDHEKANYPAAFEQVVEKLAPNGVVIADNVLDGPVWYEDLLPYLEDPDAEPDDEREAGIVRYLRAVTQDPGIHTTVLPVSEGLAVSAVDPERF